MKSLRRTLVVAALLLSIAGIQSATNAAVTVSAEPPAQKVLCCWTYMSGRWVCIPCG